MIRVLIVDDQALVRAGFRMLLDAQDDIEVVGEAANGDEATQLAARLQPDVVLMDIRMPGTDGLQATKTIVASGSDTKVLILTTFELDEYVFEALRAGASGFLAKDVEPAELIKAIHTIHDGGSLLSPGATRALIGEFVARPTGRRPQSEALDGLTEREREVVALVAAGLSNEEIAAELVISEATARTHVSRAMLKVGARDRAQLVVMAYESGLVVPPATR